MNVLDSAVLHDPWNAGFTTRQVTICYPSMTYVLIMNEYFHTRIEFVTTHMAEPTSVCSCY